jgi:DNA-directed RNA polymerase subunit RPC12/RpoP
MVASSGHRAIVVAEQERPMIEEGDGSFERLLRNHQCPRCRSAIVLRRDDVHKREYACTVCNLKIIDVKGDTEG